MNLCNNDTYKANPSPDIEKIRPSHKAEIAEITGKGRGVVATENLEQGECVLCDAAERYSGEEAAMLQRSEIYFHLFVDPVTFGQSSQVDLVWAIGMISLVNHSKYPNCKISWRSDGEYEWASLITLREISAEEELTIFYTNIKEYKGYQNFE